MTAMLNLVTTMLQTAPLSAVPLPTGVPAMPFAAILDDVAPVPPAETDDLPTPAEPTTAAQAGDDAADSSVDGAVDGAVDDDAPAVASPPVGPLQPQLPPALLLTPAATPVPAPAAAPSPVSAVAAAPVAAAPASASASATSPAPVSSPTTDTEPTSAPTESAQTESAPTTPFALPTPTPTPAATPATAAAPAPSPSPGVVPEAPQPALAAALGRLRHGPDGVHQLEIALHPADLGSVQVRVTITHGTLDVTVACADPAARDAVSAALPSLHRDLAGLHRVDLAPDRPFADARSDQQEPRDQRDTPDQQPRHARRQPAAPDDEFDRWM